MLFENLKSVIKTPTIEFLCEEDLFGMMPEPYPARKFMPEWFKELPPKLNRENKIENSTIKRCAPVLDAMSVGWIIPLCGDVEFISNNNASGVNYKWTFMRTLVENHNVDQISTQKAPHPQTPKPPMKFLNYWAIKVPKGYSVLFVPPLNRQDPRFTCMSGFVDCDGYFEYINFPFFFNIPSYTGIVEAGVPLVQAIPIKRDGIIQRSNVRKFNKQDHEDLDTTRKRRKSHESIYRDFIWNRK
jgi:hypothetical protein